MLTLRSARVSSSSRESASRSRWAIFVSKVARLVMTRLSISIVTFMMSSLHKKDKVTCRVWMYLLNRINVKMRNLERIQRRNAKVRNSSWHLSFQQLQDFLQVCIQIFISEMETVRNHSHLPLAHLTALAAVRPNTVSRRKKTFILSRQERTGCQQAGAGKITFHLIRTRM